MTLAEALNYLKKQSMLTPNMEICGALGKDGENFVAQILKNKHPDPKNYFSVDPLELLAFSRKYRMVSIFHSHCVGDSQASDFDKKTSENIEIPFLIYSLPEKKFNLFIPEFHDCDVEELKEIL